MARGKTQKTQKIPENPWVVARASIVGGVWCIKNLSSPIIDLFFTMTKKKIPTEILQKNIAITTWPGLPSRSMLSRRAMVSRLAAASLSASFATLLATSLFGGGEQSFAAEGGGVAPPTTGGNKKNRINSPFLVVSLFSAEYNAATALADQLLLVDSNGKINQLIESQVTAFDSYDNLLKKSASLDTGSVILPLEYFNPRVEALNKGNFLNNFLDTGYRAAAIIKPVPLFLVTRGNIKTTDQLLQKPTARAVNNILLSQLLDDFLLHQFALKPNKARDIAPTSSDDASDASDDTNSNDVAPSVLSREGVSRPSQQDYFFNYANNFIGRYNNQEELLQQFVVGQIDWFFYLGFFDNAVGERFLKKTGGRLFPLEDNSFGDAFGNGKKTNDNGNGNGNGNFITGEVKKLKNNTSFALPLVWLIKGNDSAVRVVEARARDRASKLLLPRPVKLDGTSPTLVTWKDFAFARLPYHPAILS